jgi:hypothetical protein
MKGSYFKEYSKALRSAAVQSLGGKCSKCGEMEKLRICSREPEKKNRQKLWREIATNPEVRSKFFLLCPKCNKSRVSNILKRPSFSTKVKWWVDALITGVYSPDDSFLDERFWNLLFELSGMTQGQFVKELQTRRSDHSQRIFYRSFTPGLSLRKASSHHRNKPESVQNVKTGRQSTISSTTFSL